MDVWKDTNTPTNHVARMTEMGAAEAEQQQPCPHDSGPVPLTHALYSQPDIAHTHTHTVYAWLQREPIVLPGLPD